MSLKEVSLKKEYRSSNDNIITDFYIPLLRKSTIYKRAVGFFSSSSLLEISIGITELIKNNGKIKIIASPELNDKDIEAINKGYSNRDKVIIDSITDKFKEPQDYFEEERYNLLAYLIEEGRLDIKIALTKNNKGFGIYHEKVGLIYDDENNIVVFSGSMNESKNAYVNNYETIDVFASWTDDIERVKSKEKFFEKIWNNSERNLFTLDFNEKTYNFLKKYRKDNLDINIDKKQFPNDRIFEESLYKYNEYPKIPNEINLYDYQNEAIRNWEENNYVGIFDMATGTGKTFTGLGAIVNLSKERNHKLFVIIVCPFQHLVEQWTEDIYKFKINPIIGYSKSKQKNWKELLKDRIRNQNLGVNDDKFVTFICTNATFRSDYVQKMIKKIKEDVLLVVDEAHNFGAQSFIKLLKGNYKYRLALSATFERFNDEEGTEALYDFFKIKCIDYPIERAIKEKKLTPYKYYPILTYLKEDERNIYNELSYEMSRNLITDKNGKVKLNERGKFLAIKRARIVAASKNKVEKLLKIIEKYKYQKHMLIYCGAANIINYEEIFEEIVDYSTDESEIRQIEVITKLLGNQLNMKVSKFTSDEDISEREILKKQFSIGKNLQALVAIKCLDEGVNIPSIKTAFILASTTNPKEYVQRRGRVLRNHKNKEYAEIYDFITLPRPLDEVKLLTNDQMTRELSLVKKEIERMEEFCSISMNQIDSYNIIWDIKDKYELDS